MLSEKSQISTGKFIFLLILAVFLEAAGYIAFPFLTVRLRDHFGLSTEQTGAILLLAFWLRPAASLILGTFFSKASTSKLSFISCMFEAIAFFGLAISTSAYVGALSLILGNIGLALWRPGLFASIYNDKTHPKRSQRISLLNGALNGGLVLGCLVGALLVKYDATWAFYLSGGMYALLAIPIFVLMRPAKGSSGMKSLENANSHSLKPEHFILISIATICSWASLGQFTSYIGLLADDYLLDPSYTGVAFSISGITILVVSILMAKQSKLDSKLPAISLAGLIFALFGWGALRFIPSIWIGLTIFVIFLSLFEAIIVLVIAEKWSYLGAIKGQSYNYSVRCIGQGVGGLIGGYLYVAKGTPSQLLPWIWANWILLFIFLGTLVSFDMLLKNGTLNTKNPCPVSPKGT